MVEPLILIRALGFAVISLEYKPSNLAGVLTILVCALDAFELFEEVVVLLEELLLLTEPLKFEPDDDEFELFEVLLEEFLELLVEV
jgi:hypothetical protein